MNTKKDAEKMMSSKDLHKNQDQDSRTKIAGRVDFAQGM